MTDAAPITLRVLFVEDSADDVELVLRLLRKEGYAPVHRRIDRDGELQHALREEPWDLVICDYTMPAFSAPQALATFQQFHLDIPFIVVSGAVGEETAVQMMKAGAHDYVMKQNPTRLVPAIRRELAEAQERAARRRAEKELLHLAFYDRLTGLPNQTLLRDRLDQAIAYTRRDNEKLAVLQINIDRFKNVNDTLGQVIGDRLLYGAAERLLGAVAADGTVARVGGNTFAALITRLKDVAQAHAMADRLRAAIAQPAVIDGREIHLSASIGIAVFPQHGTDAATLMRHAEGAMHDARAQGGNNSALFAQEGDAISNRRFTIENNLRRALREQEFEVHYQPQVDLKTGAVHGVEALVRWHDPEFGTVLPDHFISVAEDSGIILALGEWILGQACRDYVQWQRLDCAPQKLSINLSVRQLADPAIPALLERTQREFFADGAGTLEMEVTESGLMRDTGRAISVLGTMRAQGIHVALDDFGTGYSSLAYLKHLPIDVLKIDKSFVTDVASSPQDQAIVSSVIALARSLNMKVLAEGVETEAQRDFLRANGCDAIQGYLFSKPLDSSQLQAFMLERRTITTH